MVYNDQLFQKNLTSLSDISQPLKALLSETDVFATLLHKQIEDAHHFFVLHRTKPVHLNPVSIISRPSIHAFSTQVSQAGKESLVMIGVGTGEHLSELSKLSGIHRICVVEKNVSLMRFVLGCYDFSTELSQGKIDFALPLDFVFNKRANFKNSAIIAHPVLGVCYNDVTKLIFNYKEDSKIDLLLDGSLMIDDWYDTLSKENLTYIYPPNMYPVAQISEDFSLSKVGKIWSVNRIEGVADLAKKANRPYIIYEIDPDLSPIPQADVESKSQVFTFRTSRVEAYTEKGWAANFLALATAPERFQVSSNPSFSCDISFVGASMLDTGEANLNFLKKHSNHPLASHLIDNFKEDQQSNPDFWMAPKFMTNWKSQGFSEFINVNGRHLSVLHFVSEWSGACNRLHFVKACAEFGIHVWGDPTWEKHLQSTNAQYRGFAKHKTEVPLIYASSKITLDITRIYQPDVATLRLFDAFAAGSAVISNLKSSDSDLFSKPELIRFSTSDDLKDRIEKVLNWQEQDYQNYVSEMKRQTIERHTFDRRLEQIKSVI